MFSSSDSNSEPESAGVKGMNEKTEDLESKNIATPVSSKNAPVSVFSLFRYATKLEIFLNTVSLIPAAAAGAGQPAMTLLFGRLVQDFVNFTDALEGLRDGQADAQTAVDQAASEFRQAAALNASYIVFVGLGLFACTYIYTMAWGWTSERLSKRIRERYLWATLRQDVAYFDAVGPGEIASRIQTDSDLVQKGIGEKVPHSIMVSSAFVTAYLVAYIQEWRLSLALTSILPVMFIAGAVLNKALGKNIQESLKQIAEGGSVAEEVVSSIRTIQAFGIQDMLYTLYKEYVTKSRQAGMNTAKWMGIVFSIMIFSVYAAYALVFYFGTTLIIQGLTTPGKVISVIFAVTVGTFSIVQLTPELQAIQEAKGAATKLYSTIDRKPLIDSYSEAGMQPEDVRGDITFEDVVFQYPSRPAVSVVKGVNLFFRAGLTSAMVGSSGSGKSTVIQMLERFYDPSQGTVRLDGINIKDLNIKWLRSQIGLVSQEPTLFDTTVAMNVAHGLINTPYELFPWDRKMELIKKACLTANADSFITKLPNGYDTVVGERAILLSGGQKQRIAIARAIVSDPKILLLDEATSALDTQSEQIVQHALDKASAGRTTVSIAHRLSTVKDADCIYVMGDGLVLEQGRHDELLANESGAYYTLVQAQKLRESQEQDIPTVEDAWKELVDFEDDALSLERTMTSQSVSSHLMEKQHQVLESRRNRNYSVFELFKRMLIINKMSWGKQIIAVLLALVSGAIFPVYGIVLSSGISGFSTADNNSRRHQGDRNALLLFIIAIVAIISVMIQNYNFVWGAENLMYRLRVALFRAMLRQDIAFFDEANHNTGRLVSQLSDDPQKVNGLAGMVIGTITQAISTLLTGFIVGLVYSWKLGLVGIACSPLVIFCGLIRLHVVVLKDQRNKQAHEDSSQMACEAAGAVKTVAALTREADCVDIYSKKLEGPLKYTNKTNAWTNLLYAFAQSSSLFVIALVFWYGSRLVAEQDISSTAFFVSLMATTFGAIQAGNIFNFSADMSKAKSAAASIAELLDSVPEIDVKFPGGKLLTSKTTPGRITFDNVHFRYPTRPEVRVLSGLSLDIKPGTFAAFVGASGCGKSTTIQLIERFYDPLAGSVSLDGVPLTYLNVSSFRKQISLVSQEPTLYSGTVRFNILLGAAKPAEEVTQEEIEAACRKANVLNFVESLPDGFDTQVGGKGSQLSGGQKQRIAIARALLRNPKVLLLDEATSALDSSSEKIVQAALDQAAKGRTTIAIAHRLSTIQNADIMSVQPRLQPKLPFNQS